MAASTRREQRLAGIIASAMDAIIAIDEHHEITLVNPAAEQMFGYSAAALLGKPLSMLIPERYRGAHDAHIRNFARTKVTNRGIGRFGQVVGRRADGREFPVDAAISQMEWAGERLFTVTLRDITQRIEAETALRKNYELLDRIFATTHFCIVYLDRDLNFVRVNQAYADVGGYPPEFFVGKNHFDLYPGEKAEAIFRNAVATGQPFTIYANPFQYLDHPERGVTYWDWTLHPLRDADGAVDGLLFALLDVTERKRAEREHAQLAAIVESSNDAILIRGLDRRILSWNTAAERLFGWSAQEAVGQPIDLIVPPERKGKLRRFIEGAARDASSSPVETTHLRKDGTRIPTQVTFSAVRDQQGEVVAHSYTVRDMSELKRKEKALRGYTDRLRGLSRRLREVEESERYAIARELHDELGQTLTALKVNLQMLEPYCAEGEAEDHLTEALMITGRALEQVRGMLLDLRPLGLEDLGLAVVLESHLAKQAEAAGWDAQFETTLPGRLRPELEMACFRVAQEALTNVMRHAHAKRVWVALGLNAGEVQLSVRDDGKGFDAAAVSDASPTGGFGLIGMQERVRQLGGRLAIHSAPGRGTEVRASFPFAPAGGREPAANASTHA